MAPRCALALFLLYPLAAPAQVPLELEEPEEPVSGLLGGGVVFEHYADEWRTRPQAQLGRVQWRILDDPDGEGPGVSMMNIWMVQFGQRMEGGGVDRFATTTGLFLAHGWEESVIVPYAGAVGGVRLYNDHDAAFFTIGGGGGLLLRLGPIFLNARADAHHGLFVLRGDGEGPRWALVPSVTLGFGS